MGLLSRLFLPELDKLKREINVITAQCEGLKEQTAQSEAKDLRKQLEAEIRRNRKREDALLDQILELGGGRPLPVRIPTEQPAEAKGTNELSPQDKEILWQRVLEYVEQQPDEQLKPDEQAKTLFAAALADPDHTRDYWLSD